VSRLQGLRVDDLDVISRHMADAVAGDVSPGTGSVTENRS